MKLFITAKLMSNRVSLTTTGVVGQKSKQGKKVVIFWQTANFHQNSNKQLQILDRDTRHNHIGGNGARAPL